MHLIHASPHMFIPPHFHPCICCWGDGIKAHLRIAAEVQSKLCLQHCCFHRHAWAGNMSTCASSSCTKSQEALSYQQSWASHLLAAWRAGWRSDIWSLTEQLKWIWILGNLKLCYNSCGHIHCRENCMRWRKGGKENARLRASDLSVDNQAVGIPWAGAFRESCAIWDSPLYRCSAHEAYRCLVFFLWKSWQNSHWLSGLSWGCECFVNVLATQTIWTVKLKSKESVGSRHFIWIYLFPSSQLSCGGVKLSRLIDTVCVTQSLRTEPTSISLGKISPFLPEKPVRAANYGLGLKWYSWFHGRGIKLSFLSLKRGALNEA